MISNYLKVALRNLLKHKAYTFINVVGLSIGLACCVLILLYVKDELSYDRYHTKADRIYRVILHGRLAGNEIHAANTCVPMAATLTAEFPEVEFATRLDNLGTVLVSHKEKSFNEERVFFADSSFFDIFTLGLLSGNPKNVLSAPNSVVLTEATVRKYFGEDDPMGRTLTFDDNTDYLVTGVSENVPENSHFHFDFLASFNSLSWSTSTFWVNNNLKTYILLQENVPPSQLEAKFPQLIRKYVAPQIQQGLGVTYDEFIESGGEYNYSLQPFTNIHLYSKLEDEIEPGGNAAYITIFSIIAFFVLLLACINFMNLATARSANRAKEVGIRKVVGSRQIQLIKQFLIEAALLSFIAMVVAVFLVELFLPWFNDLAAKNIEINFLSDRYLLPGLFLVTILVSVLAGSYPAFYLAAFKPIAVLKGASTVGATGRSPLLRKILVVFQFAVSIILIIGTLVVGKQMQYIRNKQLGFNKEQVVVIHRADATGDISAFETEIERLPNVISAAATRHLPGQSMDVNVFKPEGAPETEGYLVNTFSVGYDYIETLGIELLAGRSFSRDFGSDSSAYIINEAAMKKFGWDEAVGKTILEPDQAGPLIGQVIGLMKDFHYKSLHAEIEPALLRLASFPTYVASRISSDNIQGTLSDLEKIWQEFAPEQPFQYSFLDQDFDKLYRADQQVGKLVGTFTVFAICIACLGLFGLASFSAEQRTKEIGVRKVLGASVPNIILLLSKEFTKLVIVAFIIAAPIALYAMNKWLQEFAYKTDINILIFILAGSGALLIAYLTVGYQAAKAALANPIDALKYE
ncbi:ABC transporter permease [candidate division KSB1 bacterium]|nr:ABC transporter permease [candidate division KSB1 bacterium]